MFYVSNDDNMEDLFREAANRYPLKIEGAADWEKMSAALREEAGMPLADAGDFKKEKKRRVFLWWILLLPLGWIGHDSWQKLNAAKNEKALTAQTDKSKISSNNKEPEKLNTQPLSKTEHVEATDVAANSKKNIKHVSVVPDKINGVQKMIADSKSLKTERAITLENAEKNRTVNTIAKKSGQQKNNLTLNKDAGSNNKNEKIIADDKDKNKTDIAIEGASKTNDALLKTNADKSGGISTKKDNDDLKSHTGSLPDASIKNADKPLAAGMKNEKQSKAMVTLKKDFHFYAAIMVGGDIRTIKFQSVKGMGNSVGLLLGYHFSRSKFNIETGVYWDTKKYYTSGEYFDKSKVPYFNNPNVNLEYVNGNCNMFEIPVNVRYNIIQHKNTSFFSVLGLSSYLMNKEAYGYGYKSNGWSGYSEYAYYHSTKNWFSIINLSAGYEHRLGKIGDIRIEPYAKLPISGIGKGSLSIMSAGLNVGLSKQF